MIINYESTCPKCGNRIKGPFPNHCPFCSFNIDALAGRGTTSFQVKKWQKHSDLLYGRNIQLTNGEIINTSFDFHGYANLDDIVRFTITYGERSFLKSRKQINPVIISYIPEVIGAGTAIYSLGTIPCSGICIISPSSNDYSHPFPVIDVWVKTTFPNMESFCRICQSPTTFGQPFCEKCYESNGSNWRNFIS